MITARNNSNTPSTAIPSNLNGSNSSQNSGYRQSASKAKGQHTNSKIKNKSKLTMANSVDYLYQQVLTKEYAGRYNDEQAYRRDQQSIHVFTQFHDLLLKPMLVF